MKGKILIIDDEKNILATLSDILQDEGHLVSTAETGEKGLKIIRETGSTDKEIEVLLLDVKLPDCNGIDLLKQIKSEFPKIEVIMNIRARHSIHRS